MTEAEWMASEDPGKMLDFIQTRASDRRLRMFLVACARLGWDRLPEGEVREAVEVAERFADGLAPDEERQRLGQRLWAIPVEYSRETGGNWFMARPREDVSAYMSALLCASRELKRSRVTSRPSWSKGG